MIKAPKFTYKINKEKRTVVAYGKFCPKYLIGCEFINSINRDVYFPSHYSEKVVKGIAKCHPNDEWNEKEGKRIARERAIKEFYGQMRACWARESAILMAAFDNIDEQLKKRN